MVSDEVTTVVSVALAGLLVGAGVFGAALAYISAPFVVRAVRRHSRPRGNGRLR